MTTPFDQGFDLYKSEPDLMLIEVARRAPNGAHGPKQDFLDFVDGYIAARRQRERKEDEDHEQDRKTG